MDFQAPHPIPPIIVSLKRCNKIFHRCKMCDRSGCFGNFTLLMEHHNVVHRRLLLACGSCEKAYTRRSNLRVHQKAKHHSGLRYGCAECGAGSNNETEFDQHRFSIHHNTSPILPLSSTFRSSKVVNFACGSCEKAFTRRSNLRDHQKAKHHSGLRYVCEECGVVSNNEIEFYQHRFSIHHTSPILPSSFDFLKVANAFSSNIPYSSMISF